MSKSSIGLRRAGVAGLAVAMSLGIAGLTAGAAFAATTPGLHAASAPNVTQGGSNQAAGDLTYAFTNNYTTGATIKFTVPAATTSGTPQNDCTTQAGIDSAIEFAAAPTVAISHDNSTDTGRIPTFTTALGSSSAACATAGIQDTFTVTLTQPSSGGTPADVLDLNLTSILYNVGVSAPPGSVNVHATATGVSTDVPAADDASNANVTNTTFMVVPRMSAEPGTNGNPLGTVTFTETNGSPNFPNGSCIEVQLGLGNEGPGTQVTGFTSGVQPTVTVPAGYSVWTDSACTATAGAPAQDGTTAYDFYVKAPAANAGKATVTVAGLEADSDETGVGTLTGTVGANAASTAKALNVVEQDRTGGVNRYYTAANIYEEDGQSNSGCPPIFCGGYGNAAAVLSSGQNFPDALSANYLSGEIGTGTLLTKTGSLSPAARQEILNSGVDTVFITGQTKAVSQKVEDQITSMHVNGSPLAANIQVIRLGGANRYATNRDINEFQISQSNTVIMATGKAPWDSLSVGPVVGANGDPLILTDGTALDHGEVTQLNDFGAQNVVIAGGTDVVSQAVQDQLTADGFHVYRVAGANRYETATQVADWATHGLDTNGDGTVDSNDGYLGNGPEVNSLYADAALVATGQKYPDALTGGPLGADNETPLLLAKDPNTVGPALTDYLAGRSVGEFNYQYEVEDGYTVELLHALGLTAATTNAMMRQAAADIENP